MSNAQCLTDKLWDFFHSITVAQVSFLYLSKKEAGL